jgi:DNA-binding CsgD family transcriptional regulator
MGATQRPEAGSPYAQSSLDRPLPTYVAAAEGIAAGIVMHALEREGLNVNGVWGPLDGLQEAHGKRLELVVVVEPDDRPHAEPDYARLRSVAPHSAIAVICSADRERPQGLLWAGVDGIIFEPGADAVVGPAVRALLAGYVVVPDAVRAGVQPPPLTRRERQMLELVVEGLTNREIAERLYLAESTVKRHLSATFRRLGVASRREAVAAALATEQRFSPVSGSRGPKPSS